MSTWRSISVSGSAVKSHVCSGCGNVYEYEMHRSSGASGKTVPSQYQLEQTVTDALKTGCDMVPCPACGLFQPEMVRKARDPEGALESMFMLSIFGGGFVCMLIWLDLWTWLAAFIWFLIGAMPWGGLGGAMANPNKDIARTRNGTPVPGSFQGMTPSRKRLSRLGYLALLTTLAGIVLLLGGPFFFSSISDREFNHRFLNPGIQPTLFGPGSTIALARNAFAPDHFFHPFTSTYVNSRVDGTLTFSGGRIVPLESPGWTEADKLRFGLEDLPAASETLKKEIEKRAYESRSEARVCPMILMRIPASAPSNEKATLRVIWEIRYIGTVEKGGRGLKTEKFEKTFNVRIDDANATKKDSALYWGRIALLAATCIFTMAAGWTYPDAAAI